MAIYLSNRDGNGKTSEEGHYRLQTRSLKGFSLFAGDLKVVQNSPLAMSIKVQTGDYRLENPTGYSYTGWLSSEEIVTIPTADPANPRISAIVIYVDKTAATSATPPNNPGITKIIAVNASAAAVPSVPSAAAIQAAVGGTNPYYILATVQVPAGAGNITNAMITDARTQIGIIDDVLKGSNLKAIVGDLLYPVGSVYVNMDVATNPNTLLGFGTWAAVQGKFLVGVDATQTEFTPNGTTGGAKTHRHTGYGDGGDLRATIGSSAGDAASINFQALDPINPNTGAGLGAGTYTINGSMRSNLNFSHYTKVVGFTSTVNGLPPYQVVYMWRRTA